MTQFYNMEVLNIENLIREKAIEEKCIYIIISTKKHSKPYYFNQDACFINSVEPNEIVANIANFIEYYSEDGDFTFDLEFYENEARFTIDGYKYVYIKNCNSDLKIDFANIEKSLYEKLIDSGLRTNYNPFK